ncbi:MAG: hypothetical protein HYS13_26060 [Planctomycetia bacterium]|nr:hypothetical protein [Planctomycetia bacterium]
MGPRNGEPLQPYNLPPAQMLAEPGPGVGGPGPGVMMPQVPAIPVPPQASQVYFVGPDGMMVQWSTTRSGAFDSEPLVCPGSYDFPQGAIYRLKLSHVPGRGDAELYPSLEIGPTTPRTEAFLAHNKIPVQFTEEDFGQVLSGNYVTKVIYLPDPEFQELAVAGIEVLVSTRLDPGVDPIVEADRRGAILAVIRIGNKDLQLGGGAAGPMRPAGFMLDAQGRPMAEGAAPTLTPGYISGVTVPQYGMPYVGTPIGLPGPPHIPLGGPAGLQRHTIINHTDMHIPGPTGQVDIHVKQSPGLSYPQPANRVLIKEQVTPSTAGQPEQLPVPQQQQ